MTSWSEGTSLRRLIARASIGVFAAIISTHLAIRAYWTAADTTPAQDSEPRAYGNVLGDLEPRRAFTSTEIQDLPYAVSINEQGFRGKRELLPGKPENRLRVLCLGDSFTYGVGVDDQFTYPALLQIYLQQRFPDREVEVVNAGVPFYDIFDELSYYRDKGRRLHADVVVLQFYINDLEAMASAFFRQDLLQRQGGIYNAFDQAIGAEVVERRLNDRLASRFPLLDRLRQAPALSAGPSPASTGPFRRYHFQASPAERALLADKAALLDARNLPALNRFWTNYRQALRVFNDEVQRDGAAFLFVLAPDVAQVREDLNSPAAALVPFCRENGIPVIDLARKLRAAAHGNPDRAFLVPRNPHPNAEGNTIMAKAVADALRPEPGTAGPRIAVSPTDVPFAYADPIPLLLRLAPEGVAPVSNGPVSVTTVASENLRFMTREMEGGNRIAILHPDLHQGPDASLVLRLDAAVPLDQVSLTLFRRLFAPVNGFVQLAWSRDGVDYTPLLFASDSDAPAAEAFETGRLVELDLRQAPARRIYLRLLLHNAVWIFAESKASPWRRFEIVCYPAATAEPSPAGN